MWSEEGKRDSVSRSSQLGFGGDQVGSTGTRGMESVKAKTGGKFMEYVEGWKVNAAKAVCAYVCSRCPVRVHRCAHAIVGAVLASSAAGQMGAAELKCLPKRPTEHLVWKGTA